MVTETMASVVEIGKKEGTTETRSTEGASSEAKLSELNLMDVVSDGEDLKGMIAF
jgi:hypothetical protein